jgi:flagellar capping protein FliD
MQLRLDKYEESLRRQYAMLEQTIAGLQSQGNSLNSILSSM